MPSFARFFKDKVLVEYACWTPEMGTGQSAVTPSLARERVNADRHFEAAFPRLVCWANTGK